MLCSLHLPLSLHFHIQCFPDSSSTVTLLHYLHTLFLTSPFSTPFCPSQPMHPPFLPLPPLFPFQFFSSIILSAILIPCMFFSSFCTSHSLSALSLFCLSRYNVLIVFFSLSNFPYRCSSIPSTYHSLFSLFSSSLTHLSSSTSPSYFSSLFSFSPTSSTLLSQPSFLLLLFLPSFLPSALSASPFFFLPCLPFSLPLFTSSSAL